MNVNSLIQDLQALVDEDASNGELMVLVDDGCLDEGYEEAGAISLAEKRDKQGYQFVYRVSYESRHANCIVIE